MVGGSKGCVRIKIRNDHVDTRKGAASAFLSATTITRTENFVTLDTFHPCWCIIMSGSRVETFTRLEDVYGDRAFRSFLSEWARRLVYDSLRGGIRLPMCVYVRDSHVWPGCRCVCGAVEVQALSKAHHAKFGVKPKIFGRAPGLQGGHILAVDVEYVFVVLMFVSGTCVRRARQFDRRAHRLRRVRRAAHGHPPRHHRRCVPGRHRVGGHQSRIVQVCRSHVQHRPRPVSRRGKAQLGQLLLWPPTRESLKPGPPRAALGRISRGSTSPSTALFQLVSRMEGERRGVGVGARYCGIVLVATWVCVCKVCIRNSTQCQGPRSCFLSNFFLPRDPQDELCVIMAPTFPALSCCPCRFGSVELRGHRVLSVSGPDLGLRPGLYQGRDCRVHGQGGALRGRHLGGGMDQAISMLGAPGIAKLVEFDPVRAHDVPLPAARPL